MQALEHSTVTSDVDPDQEIWFLKTGSDILYGPVSLNELVSWSRSGRLQQGSFISQDRQSWTEVEAIPQLQMDWMVEIKSRSQFGPFNIGAADLLDRRGMVDPQVLAKNIRTGETRKLVDESSQEKEDAPAVKVSAVKPVSEEQPPASDEAAPVATAARVVPVSKQDDKPEDDAPQQAEVKPALKVKPVSSDKTGDQPDEAAGSTVVLPKSQIKKIEPGSATKPIPAAPASTQDIEEARETIAKLRTENTFLKRQAHAEREGFKRRLDEMMNEYEQAYEDHNRSQQETVVREKSYAARIKALEDRLKASSTGDDRNSEELVELQKQLQLEAERRQKIQEEAAAKEAMFQSRIAELQSASAESVAQLEKARADLAKAGGGSKDDLARAEAKVSELQKQVLSLQAEREKLNKSSQKHQQNVAKDEQVVTQSEVALKQRIAELEKRTALFAEERDQLKQKLVAETEQFEHARKTVVKQAQSEIDAMKALLSERDKQITSLKQSSGNDQAILKRAEDAENKLAVAEEKIISLEKDLATGRQDSGVAKQLQAELHELKDVNAQLQAQLTEAKTKQRESASPAAEKQYLEKIKSLEASLSASESRCQEQSGKFAAATTRLKQMEEQIQHAQAQQTALNDVKSTLAKLQESHQGIEKQLKAAETENKRLQAQIKDHDSADKRDADELAALKKSLATAQADVDAREKAFKDLKASSDEQVTSLKARLEAGSKEFVSLRDALSKAQDDLKQAQAQSSKRDTAQIDQAVEAAMLKAEKQFSRKLADEQAKLQSELAIAQTNLENMQEALKDSEQRLQAAKAENDELSRRPVAGADGDKVRSLESSISDMQDRCDQLVASLDAERASREALAHEFSAVESQYKTRIAELEQAGRDVLSELSGARRTIEQLQAQNAQIREAAANDADQLTRQLLEAKETIRIARSSDQAPAEKKAPSPGSAGKTAVSKSKTGGADSGRETVPTLKDVLALPSDTRSSSKETQPQEPLSRSTPSSRDSSKTSSPQRDAQNRKAVEKTVASARAVKPENKSSKDPSSKSPSSDKVKSVEQHSSLGVKSISPVKNPSRQGADEEKTSETTSVQKKDEQPKDVLKTSVQPVTPASRSAGPDDSPQKPSATDSTSAADVYYLKIDDDQVFGPESLEVLKDWAGQLRVSPEHQLSKDKNHWLPAHEVPGLEMEWLVEVETGNYFGPFNSEGVRSLHRDQMITHETPVYNTRTEAASKASDLLG